jgi:hypothetical protein
MSRVAMNTQAWGVLQDEDGNVLPNQSVQVKNRDGTPATHYSARTGGTSSTATITTDSNGRLDRYLDPGEYILTVGPTDYDIEAASGSGSADTRQVVQWDAVTGWPSRDPDRLAEYVAPVGTLDPSGVQDGDTFLYYEE